MSYRRRHRWFRRMALGLAFASVMFAGSASVVSAMIDPGTQQYVTAGGWSGMVDLESGIPLSAGIPDGDEEFLDEQAAKVIPYLSHGMLTPQDEESLDEQAAKVIPYLSHGMLTPQEANATAAQTDDDPYLNDVNVRPGESLGGPDGGPRVTRPALETQVTRAEKDEQADDEQTPQVWTDRD